MSENVIEIKGLYKSFGKVRAVDDLSLSVKRGELFAFLGINGAGKSTTISIMCGVLAKDGGTVVIDGVNIDDDPDKIKSEIGVVFQNSVLDKPLGVKDNLASRAALYGLYGEEFEKRYEELDALLGLKEMEGRAVGKLSGGQRRRVDIARALIHDPKILILDEPTTGLDPQTRKKLWDIVGELRRKKDMTVFLTTHYMEEAAEADYVVIIDSGKKSAEGTPLELKNKYTGDYVNIYGTGEEEVKKLGLAYTNIRDGYRVSVKDTGEARDLIVKYPETFADFEIIKGKMDDVFLTVTGKEVGEETK